MALGVRSYAARVLGVVRARSLRCIVSGQVVCCAGGSNCADVVREAGVCGSDTSECRTGLADVLVVTGTVTGKTGSSLQESYDEMREPRWVVAVGDCACTGGPFREYRGVVPGTREVLPVDESILGCPPSVERVQQAFESLRASARADHSSRPDGATP